MKNQLKLSELKVESFVTSLDNQSVQTVLGGGKSKSVCITVKTAESESVCIGSGKCVIVIPTTGGTVGGLETKLCTNG